MRSAIPNSLTNAGGWAIYGIWVASTYVRGSEESLPVALSDDHINPLMSLNEDIATSPIDRVVSEIACLHQL